MSFNFLFELWQRRTVRAGVALLVLAAATFAQYKLAHVPRTTDLAAEGKFAPATIKLGEQQLIIEGPVVNAEQGLLFSYESGTNAIVQVGFDRARLDEQTVELFEELEIKLPATWASIDYRAEQNNIPRPGKPCSTGIELRASAKTPAEIRISQFGELGRNSHRHVQIIASDAELIANLGTEVQGESDLAPGCQKTLTVDKLSHSTSLDLTAHVAENSEVRLTFLPLGADSKPWGDEQGSVELLLGGSPKLKSVDAPPFQARAVSIRSLDTGAPTKAATVLSARSEAGGPLLSISGLKVFSDKLEVNVAGKGMVEINGVAQTTNLLQTFEENPITSALLLAANAALLAWVARLVFKSPQASSETKDN
jgi:hypothetical protein